MSKKKKLFKRKQEQKNVPVISSNQRAAARIKRKLARRK